MAAALADILSSLNSVYQPQKDLVNQQLTNIPQQYAGQMAGLDQQKTNAFTDINNQANSRGLDYSGMPVAEEQRYTGASYLPAVAALKADQQNRTFGLQDTLNKIGQQQFSQANDIQNTQLNREQQDRQFQQQLALNQSIYGNMYGNHGGSGGGGSSGGGGYSAAPQAAAAPQGGYNPQQLTGLIQQLRNANGPTNRPGWGQLAQTLSQRGINTAHGSAADQALRHYFGAG